MYSLELNFFSAWRFFRWKQHSLCFPWEWGHSDHSKQKFQTASKQWHYSEMCAPLCKLQNIWVREIRERKQTWFRGSLEHRCTPFSLLISLRDTNRELVHAVRRECFNHETSLSGVLVFPSSRFSFLSVFHSVIPAHTLILKLKYILSFQCLVSLFRKLFTARTQTQ